MLVIFKRERSDNGEGSLVGNVVKDIVWIVKMVFVVFVLSWALNQFIAVAYKVDGLSMYPTLNDGDLLYVNKAEVLFGEIDRFDVVVFHKDGKTDYVKRVIGLPGDEIVYRDDTLMINGEVVDEPFLDSTLESWVLDIPFTENFELGELTGVVEVPEDSYFVLGDNRENSMDSRAIGYVKKDQIVGVAAFKYFPLSSIGRVN